MLSTMNRFRVHPELIILIALAIITRTWQLFTPKSVVFDEVYFKAFAGHYLDGQYFFDIHPPLGKLLLAGWAYIWGISGSQLATTPAVPLRIVPVLFGITLIPIVWGIVRKLGGNRWIAFTAAFLITADNALTVESRFILTDTILLATGLGALYIYLATRQSKGYHRVFGLIAAALLAGASMGTKWTGLTSLAIVGLLWLYDTRSWLFDRRWWQELAILVIIPLALYTSLFFAHLHLLPRSGEGDAFMSTRFQSTLVGNHHYSPTANMSFLARFVELNTEMFQANQTLTATHPYGSHWYAWPLELRPIYYWQGDSLENGKQGNIYLLGNPVVWWGGTLALLSGAAIALIRIKQFRLEQRQAIIILLTAYSINYLPFAAVTRVMFLYHYFFSFIYGLIAAVVIWGWIIENSKLKKHRNVIFTAVIAIASMGFIYFAPLTYGIPLAPNDLQERMWLKSWR
jgi:dolichyl-phosphate-mannose-protein mannosyltransferase